MVSGINLPADLLRVQALAQHHSTPMHPGQMRWHQWGQVQAGRAPLVLLHGGSGSWMHWLRNIEPLVAAGYELWAPDLPSFGDSDLLPQGQDADAMVAHLALALRQLLGGRACELIGFSFGGMLAGLLAAQCPQLLRRLVLVGAPAMGVAARRPFTLKGWRHLPTQAQQLVVHRYNLAALMFYRQALADDPDTLALHAHNVQRDRLPRRRLSGTDILARELRRVRCPVQAIYGAHDVLYHDAMHQLEATFVSNCPGFAGLELIAEAGHWVQYEQPAAFDAVLLRVLEREG